MNNPDQLAYGLLQQAQQARKAGDKRAARRFAEQAARLAPEWEDPWILLAALASPRASVAYLEHALKLNPLSQRAQQGMAWATNRLKQEAQADTQPVAAIAPATAKPSVPVMPPRAEQVEGRKIAAEMPTGRIIAPVTSKAVVARKFPFAIVIILLLLCVLVGFTVLGGGVSPVLASLRNNTSAQVELPTATMAPTLAAVMPTEAPTATPTITWTPTPTETATPRATLEPSATPTITETPLPSETPFPTETPVPTETPNPYATAVVFNSPNIVPPGDAADGARWIDVDLTNQMVYAFEGNTVINSFVVSTGTWQHPTVTGQYRIWIKLRSTAMSGPGYYLPNVPYTMYFYKGYALHGTYWHNNFGVPMSHGCVNLSIPDSEWLFNFASVGTLVNVHY